MPKKVEFFSWVCSFLLTLLDKPNMGGKLRSKVNLIASKFTTECASSNSISDKS